MPIESWVPIVISKSYERYIADCVSDYPTLEDKACMRRLVTDARMRPVYRALSLADEDWGILFDILWNHAALRSMLKGKKALAYKLIGEIEAKSLALSQTLQRLKDTAAAGALTDPWIYQISLSEFEERIPAVEALAGVANEFLRYRGMFGGEIQHESEMLEVAAVSGTAVSAYFRSIFSAIRHFESLSAVNRLSDENLAALIAVALDLADDKVSADAIKKLRQRKQIPHLKSVSPR